MHSIQRKESFTYNYNKFVGVCQQKQMTKIEFLERWITEHPGAQEIIRKNQSLANMKLDDKKHSLLRACVLRSLVTGHMRGFSIEDSENISKLSDEMGAPERPNGEGYDVYYRATIRSKIQMLTRLRGAWVTYCYLKSWINRKPENAWVGLDQMYIRGVLGTVRTGPYAADEMGITIPTFYNHRDKLIEAGLVKMFYPYTHKRIGDSPAAYYALGTWNIVEGKIFEYYYLDSDNGDF